MKNTKSRGLVAALTIIGIIAGQMAIVTSAEAKRPKCFSTPVPGHPGTFVVTCSTKRP